MPNGGGWRSFLRYDEEQDRPEISWALIRRALAYGRPYLGRIAVMLLLIMVVTLLGLVPPLLVRNLIDRALPERDFQRLTWLALGMLAVPLVNGLLGVAQRYLGSSVGEGIICDLRTELFGRLHRMALRFFTHIKTGELLSRLNNDVIGAQRAVSGTIVDVFTHSVTLVSALVIMLRLEWRLTLLAMICRWRSRRGRTRRPWSRLEGRCDFQTSRSATGRGRTRQRLPPRG
ncbi:MAG: ABC transporter transmembrane domain-containing protein [Candidatus Aminicenantales bacterium]